MPKKKTPNTVTSKISQAIKAMEAALPEPQFSRKTTEKKGWFTSETTVKRLVKPIDLPKGKVGLYQSVAMANHRLELAKLLKRAQELAAKLASGGYTKEASNG